MSVLTTEQIRTFKSVISSICADLFDNIGEDSISTTELIEMLQDQDIVNQYPNVNWSNFTILTFEEQHDVLLKELFDNRTTIGL